MTILERARYLGLCMMLMSLVEPAAAQSVRPITGATNVVAIYTQDWSLESRGTPRLIVAAWDDGRILWSDDRDNGGPPYRIASIDASKFDALLSRLDEDGLFDIDELSRARFGPDAATTTILIKSNGKTLQMRSWHELIEANGGIVRGSGVVSDERPRFHVLRNEPEDYLFYRFVWAEVRGRALSMIPTEGKPVGGQVQLESGALSWREGRE